MSSELEKDNNQAFLAAPSILAANFPSASVPSLLAKVLVPVLD